MTGKLRWIRTTQELVKDAEWRDVLVDDDSIYATLTKATHPGTGFVAYGLVFSGALTRDTESMLGTDDAQMRIITEMMIPAGIIAGANLKPDARGWMRDALFPQKETVN